MDVIILAAGLGTRLRPLTNTTPKPLVPVNGRGTLLRTLDILPPEIDRIILAVGYLEEQVRSAVGNEWKDRPVVYVSHNVMDGTGPTLRDCEKVIQGERFLVLNGDDLYSEGDLKELVKYERAVLYFEGNFPKGGDGWIVENGMVKGMQQVPVGGHGRMNINGLVLGREWFATTPIPTPGKSTEWSMPHAIPQLLDRYQYAAIPATFWMPVGTLEELKAAEAVIS